MSEIPTWAWVAVALAIGGALLFHHFYGKARAQSLRAFAAEMGFEYEEKLEHLSASGLMRLPIFSIGKDRVFTNVMRGRMHSRDLLVFDYRHRVGGVLTSMTENSLVADFMIGIEKNRSPTWYNMTMVAMRAPRVMEASRTRLKGQPGGHTRIERDGEWFLLYRFDRRASIAAFRRMACARSCQRPFTRSNGKLQAQLDDVIMAQTQGIARPRCSPPACKTALHHPDRKPGSAESVRPAH